MYIYAGKISKLFLKKCTLIYALLRFFTLKWPILPLISLYTAALHPLVTLFP